MNSMNNQEKVQFALQDLYSSYGYSRFKMSKFEEYDLYVRNKEFLVSDSVITFNDTDGRLLALKPDVTLSIIKNGTDEEGSKQKVYYNENVYRVSGSTHLFKEILQSGIECIGDIDVFDLYESLYLAAKSLSIISDRFVLDVSHMGVISAVLDSASSDDEFKRRALSYIADKNSHDTRKLCREYGVSPEAEELIISLIEFSGAPRDVLERLRVLSEIPEARSAYDELATVCDMLSGSEFSTKVRIDFSVVNNMGYYNGIVFKGFLDGICEGVLSGGEYDILMRRMGRSSKAIGFALYLDLLEALEDDNAASDIDVLLIYGTKNAAETVMLKKQELISKGKSVLCAKGIPSKLRFGEIYDMTKEDAR
jgi:ATP phosphoribosyltransferase regulatory subunit